MANVTWTSSSGGNWNTTTSWTGLTGGETFPGQSIADAVTLSNKNNNSQYTLTYNVATASIASLAIDGGIGVSNTNTLRMTAGVGNTLIDSGGITLNNAQARINGAGTISVGGQISGTGTIAAGVAGSSGGTLNLTGAGSIASGVVLAINKSGATTLQLDLAGGVVSAAPITIDSSSHTLKISNGNLTINNGAQNVTNGTIVMAGGTITDALGISFGTTTTNGTLSGFGTVAANLTRSGTGSADKITASGGTLDLTGTFGAGLVAAIDSTKTSNLKFDNTATSNSAISITSANQTLEIGNKGALTIGALQSVTNGTIKMDGGSLTDTAGLTIDAGASLTGFGTVTTGTTNTTDLEGAGTVTAIDGVLEFTNAANLGAGGTAYHIADTSGSVLRFGSTVGTGAISPTVTFDGFGGPGELDLSSTTLGNFHGTVNNFLVGDGIDVLNAETVSLDGTGTILTVKDAGNASLGTITFGQSHTGFNFFVNTSTDVITTDMPCFAAGTRILTATGERMVESLLQGDIVLTLADGELSAQPVKWIGRRRLERATHPRPETVAPVRIRRGAFAATMPHTDLLVSPDHAVFVDGRLICARQLINGTTIRQEKDWSSVEYFHVELDTHGILLAEGLPAESYLNTGNHGFFANSGAPLVLHPDLTDEADYPTREAGSCAPFVWDEASVRPVWQRLAERAAALGQPAPQPATTTDPGLRIVAKGRTVRPLYGENGLYIFALPKGTAEVRLVSRAGSPTDTRPWLEDRRCLGVYVERIQLRGASEVREVPLDHPGLSQGWWAVEQNAAALLRRWTGGDAVLPLPAMDGATMLEIRAGSAGMAYLTDADQTSLVA